MQRPQAGTMIQRLLQGKRGYELEVIGNATPEGLGLSVRSFAPDGTVTEHETGLSWPASIVSLGHVALPFPPGDPVYGFIQGSGRNGIPSIGSWLLRGENGAVTIALGSLTRLRSNPFWAFIDGEIDALIAADLLGPGQTH